MNLLGIAFQAGESGRGIAGWLVRQEGDQYLAGIEIAAAFEWSCVNRLPQFLGGPQDYDGTKFKCLLDRVLNFERKLLRVLFFRTKDYVATLYVRAGVLQTQRLIEGAEGVHFDPVMRAKVDAAQH